MNFKAINIGELNIRIPIFQGGMGIGVSRSGLASAVANEGGVGVISGVQIGFMEEDFDRNPLEANERALRREIRTAKEKSPSGVIGVNLMVAMQNYAEMVSIAVSEKVDMIISGAGLPLDLPKFVTESKVKLVPIVSSAKAASLIMRSWLKHYNRLPDAIIVEGPLAGGHLGFHKDELDDHMTMALKDIVKEVVETVHANGVDIPVIAAGGIFDAADIAEQLDAGAAGVQMATRFVTTEECDADPRYKEMYLQAKEEDVKIIMSPVGLPGRALMNQFLTNVEAAKREKIKKCYNCLRKCNPLTTPFCISKALMDAVQGKVSEGLVFVGANVCRSKRIETVKEIFDSILTDLKGMRNPS